MLFFISITPAMSPSTLIILTQKNIPSSFAMAFLFCQTQLTETLKVHLLSANWQRSAQVSSITPFLQYAQGLTHPLH